MRLHAMTRYGENYEENKIKQKKYREIREDSRNLGFRIHNFVMYLRTRNFISKETCAVVEARKSWKMAQTDHSESVSCDKLEIGFLSRREYKKSNFVVWTFDVKCLTCCLSQFLVLHILYTHTFSLHIKIFFNETLPKVRTYSDLNFCRSTRFIASRSKVKLPTTWKCYVFCFCNIAKLYSIK